MTVNPGELKKQIEIIELISNLDADGYSSSTEKVIRICRAKFTRTSGTELTRANADFSEVKCRFLIRYFPGISRKMIVRYCNEDYEITYINDYDDEHRYIELWCEKLTREGET